MAGEGGGRLVVLRSCTRGRCGIPLNKTPGSPGGGGFVAGVCIPRACLLLAKLLLTAGKKRGVLFCRRLVSPAQLACELAAPHLPVLPPFL